MPKSETANADFERLSEAFESCESFWIVSHIHPDPDAVGSQLALALALERIGKRVETVGRDPAPRIAQYLPGADRIRQTPENDAMDALAVVDVSSLIRIGRQVIPLVSNHRLKINIDHHSAGEPFADVACVRTQASATCEILYDYFQYAGWEIDRDIAECLYAGIIGDTGNFRFSNTTAKCFAAAADLARRGVDPQRAYERIYGSRTEGQTRLLAAALNTLKRSPDGRVATMHVTQEMYRATGTTPEDVDGFIDYARAIDGVAASALVGELPDGRIKVSFRSKGGPVKVDGLAADFGGGGHAYASGCLMEPPLEQAERRAAAALAELVARIGSA